MCVSGRVRTCVQLSSSARPTSPAHTWLGAASDRDGEHLFLSPLITRSSVSPLSIHADYTLELGSADYTLEVEPREVEHLGTQRGARQRRAASLQFPAALESTTETRL